MSGLKADKARLQAEISNLRKENENLRSKVAQLEREKSSLSNKNGFVKQNSYAGDCRNRPLGTVCIAYDDGYTWLVRDSVLGWDNTTWQGKKVRIAIGRKANYHHVLDTNLVKKVSK